MTEHEGEKGVPDLHAISAEGLQVKNKVNADVGMLCSSELRPCVDAMYALLYALKILLAHLQFNPLKVGMPFKCGQQCIIGDEFCPAQLDRALLIGTPVLQLAKTQIMNKAGRLLCGMICCVKFQKQSDVALKWNLASSFVPVGNYWGACAHRQAD